MSEHEFGPLPEGPLNVDTEKRFLGLRNRIQMSLLKEWMDEHGVSGDSSTPEGIEVTQKWSADYSGKFRKIFHQMIVGNPHLKEDVEIIPDALYEEIKLKLYSDKDHVQPEVFDDDNAERAA